MKEVLKKNGGKKMKFQEACIDVLNNDTQYRRDGGTGIRMSNEHIEFFSTGDGHILGQLIIRKDLNSDWEIVEEPGKTLSDMIYCSHCGANKKCDCGSLKISVINSDNVQQRLNALVRLLKAEGHYTKHIEGKVTELIGNGLIQD